MDYYDFDGPKPKKSWYKKELRRELAYAIKMSRIVRRVNAHYGVLKSLGKFPPR
jgi:hypothetical protein